MFAARSDLRLQMAISPLFLLAEVVQDADMVDYLAGFLHTVFVLCESTPMLVITSEEQLLQLS